MSLFPNLATCPSGAPVPFAACYLCRPGHPCLSHFCPDCGNGAWGLVHGYFGEPCPPPSPAVVAARAAELAES